MTPDAWVQALQQRHRSAMTSSEFLKAVRALSARYVERRTALRGRSPLDSAGKRAAFAAFYAPLHFFTTREIVRALRNRTTVASTGRRSPDSDDGRQSRTTRVGTEFRHLIDLGCGTGVASAAWALEAGRPGLVGIDVSAWALAEARWNWAQFGMQGRVRRADLVRSAERLAHRPPRASRDSAIIAGWSINELPQAARARLLPALVACIRQGTACLVIEPVATAVSPWWREWEAAWQDAGGAASEWRFAADLPPTLAAISDAAGFQREALTARTLWHGGKPPTDVGAGFSRPDTRSG